MSDWFFKRDFDKMKHVKYIYLKNTSTVAPIFKSPNAVVEEKVKTLVLRPRLPPTEDICKGIQHYPSLIDHSKWFP